MTNYPRFILQPAGNTLQVHVEHEAEIPIGKKALRAVATDKTKRLAELFIAAASNPETPDNEPLRINGLETYRDMQFLSELREHPDHTNYDIQEETKLLELDVNNNQYELLVDNKPVTHLFGNEQLWAYNDNKLYELRLNQQSVQTLATKANTIIPLSFVKLILEQYWPSANRLGRTKITHEIPTQIETPTPRLYLSEQDEELLIQLRFAYADQEILPGRKEDIYTYENNQIIYTPREKSTEEFYLIQFKSNHVKPTRDGYTPKKNPYSWLVEDVEELLELGFEIYGKNALIQFATHKAKLAISTKEQPDWLELQAQASFAEHKIPSHVILEMLRTGQRYIKLADQSTGVIPQKWLDKLQHKLSLLEITEQGAKIQPAHVPIIDELEEIAEEITHTKTYEQLKKTFQEFEKIQEADMPEQFNGQLREYQKAGYNWLRFLYQHNFGGILADDMGLGKTVTVLSLLQHIYEQNNNSRFLIVVPTSLVENWRAERDKFVPNMPVYAQYGPSRKQSSQELPTGMIITSYNTLRNDIELMQQINWDYIALDESHAIKNPTSQIAKAIRTLQATHRLAISGTPIENNTTELWSQMHFANPGLLGGYQAFTQAYSNPTEVEQEELKALIKPFILRRTKQSVAKDLPKKTILTQQCVMSDEQASLYEAVKEHLQEEVRQELSENAGTNKIFLALLRLRQIANHPRLVSNKYQASSGKFEALFDKIHEAIAEEHKILIFSSFTKILDLIEEEMGDYLTLRLDGSTRNRQELVKEFQTNKHVNAFLISLKAGGVGLTLTAADYVFIVDPWWNPQAEMQAIDRAHRIGQENPVFVYKFITQNTVEEKIARLQEQKLELADNLITTEEGFVKQLSKEDLIGLFE